jgi:hypothetical protein
MKKSLLITLFIICLCQLQGFAQTICNYTIRGYDSLNLQAYFDKEHQNMKYQLNGLDSSYNCAVIFGIGKDGKLNDFSFLDAPGAPLNEQAKKYIQSLFETSNGKWIYKDEKHPMDTKLIFFVALIKNNQDFPSRFKNDTIYVEFLMSHIWGEMLSKGYCSPQKNDSNIILQF